MRKLSILNVFLVLLCLATSVLYIVANIVPESIVELVENSSKELKVRIIYGTLNFSPEKDSLTLRSLEDYLLPEPQNDELKALINQMSPPDSLNTPTMAKIVAINGIPWSKILNNKQREKLIRNKGYYDPQKNTYLLELEYRGKIYKAMISTIKKRIPDILTITLPNILVLVFLLFPAISNAFRHRKLFIGIYVIFVVLVLLISHGLFTHQTMSFTFLKGAIDKTITVMLIIPMFGLLGRKYRFVPWVLWGTMVLGAVLNSSELIYIPFLLAFILAIIQERGINRKFYLEFVYLLLIFIGIVGYLIVIASLVSIWDQLENPVLKYMVYTLKAVPALLMQLFFLPFFMLLYRLIRMKIKLLEKAYLYSAITMVTILLANLMLAILFSYHKRIEWAWFLLGALIVGAYLIARFLLNLFPIIKPVRFSQRDKILKLLNKSYAYTDRKAYSAMFIDFIKAINHHYRLALYAGEFKLGDDFNKLEEPRLEEVLSLLPAGTPMLNIDVELLNDTDLGRQLLDFDHKQMPHLLFPIYDDAGIKKAVFAFGKMPGIYWHESLGKALLSLIEVFRGFYLNMLAQDELREQSKSLVQEQEARLFNEKLASVTAEKNAQLEEEKKHIIESIEYASLIQKSILPQSSDLNLAFTQNFVIWRPRDIVGGDFYWLHQVPETGEVIFAVIDCTGHGVPGALMSVAANSALDRIVKYGHLYEPAEILTALHQGIGSTLHQESEKTQQDGMDMSLIKYNATSRKLVFAAARHLLIVVKADTAELLKITGNKQSVGGLKWKQEINFVQQEVTLHNNDTIYLYTDGIVDQVLTRETGKLQRLGSQNWHEYLRQLGQTELGEQKQQINNLLTEMLKLEDQRDDICVVGIRIT